MTALHALLGILAALLGGLFLWRRRAPAPPPPPRPVDEEAHARAAEEVRAADVHLDKQLRRDPVERGNEAIEAARRRKAGLLVAFLVLTPGRAWAGDCAYVEDGAAVRCTTEGYRLLVDELDQVKRDLTAAQSGNRSLESDARVQLAALEAAQARPSWSTVALVGAGGLLVGLVVGLAR